MDVMGRMAGAVVSFVVVAIILLNTSVPLGLVVLVGVPVLLLAIGPLLKPLQTRTLAQREMTGRLNRLATDIVGGLRVLRGIGGEAVFHDRYARESQQVRAAGVRVGRHAVAAGRAAGAAPGLFVVLVVWLGARLAVEGTISAGELVAFYGYAAFLMMPLRTATEFANKLIRARGRRRGGSAGVGGAADDHTTRTHRCRCPATPSSGRPRVRAGGDARPVHGAGRPASPRRPRTIADRLGRYIDGARHYGGVPLAAATRRDVRERVLVSDASSTRVRAAAARAVDPRGTADQQATARARSSARHPAPTCSRRSPDGWDTVVEERGRSLSGGQRQRVVLARALRRRPRRAGAGRADVGRRRPHRGPDRQPARAERRRGRTTVVATTSPLLLDRVDEVALVVDGRVVATGPHRDLLAPTPRYRAHRDPSTPRRGWRRS